MGVILTDPFPIGLASESRNKVLDRLDLYSHHIEDTQIMVSENFGQKQMINEFNSVLMKKSVTINLLPLTDTSPSERRGSSSN